MVVSISLPDLQCDYADPIMQAQTPGSIQEIMDSYGFEGALGLGGLKKGFRSDLEVL